MCAVWTYRNYGDLTPKTIVCQKFLIRKTAKLFFTSRGAPTYENGNQTGSVRSARGLLQYCKLPNIKKIQDTSRNIQNFSRYFNIFMYFFPWFFGEHWFGNTALNTINRLLFKMEIGVFSVTQEPNLYVI